VVASPGRPDELTMRRLLAWRTEVQGTLRSLLSRFEQTFGYPPGGNELAGPADPADIASLATHDDPRVPDDLLVFYQVTGEVSLPDVGNGYFIHRPDLVLAHATGLVWRVTGRHTGAVVVFGSDGGGTLYALAAGTGSPVYRLPPDGIVEGTYTSDQDGFRVVASNLWDFLDQLRDAVQRFVDTGEPGPF
jgi:hypothetical protein